ncbi:MAG: hypothetical protein J07HX64_00913 [halophilic archaeon J07HX64]|nr:MAG: hypothetical protein J07HX64_00913 [halophilic archaeon J07HX64]
MDQLKSATTELGYYDEEDREFLREEIDTALDALGLDRLTDTAL